MNNVLLANQQLKKQFQKRILIDTFNNGFRDKEDVNILLDNSGIDIKLATKVNCGCKDHISQYEFFRTVVMREVGDFILWANRSGSKSFIAGLIAWIWSSMYSQCEINILGGSREQSEKSYKAMNSFFYESGLENELLIKPPLQSETVWKNRSQVSILTASQTSVRGGHPQILFLDEIDEMDFDIYDAALQQPVSKHNIPGQLGLFSTNHKIAGTMDKAVEKMKDHLFKWCIWECLESCRDYSCSTCKLLPYCPGKQMKEADGYYKIPDLLQKLNFISEHAFLTEWLCKKQNINDLVYGEEYNPDKHLKNITYQEGQECYLSIDWGGVNPFSIGVWQYFDGLGWVRVDEIYMGQTTNSRIMNKAKSQIWWDNIAGVVADPARADLIQEWNEALADKSAVVVPADNSVDAGIEAVKNALSPIVGDSKLYIGYKCKDWIREVRLYRQKNGKIEKRDDHAMDETRYFVRWKIEQCNDDTGGIVVGTTDTMPMR
jgi:hypothetical protein